MKYFNSYFILFFIIKKIFSFSAKEFFKDANSYRNYICSYNGIATYNKTTNEVICKCFEKYADEPKKDKIKKINGHIVHCSYTRKSRFMTLFLALCIPFGFDFLYLENYYIFVIVFTSTILIVAANIILFIINYKINLKSKETKIQNRLNKMTNKIKDPGINEDNKNIKIFAIITHIITPAHVFYMITVVILHFLGIIVDGNHVATENDLDYMFSFAE